MTEESARAQCPAFKAQCRKCYQRGHFARVWKSKKETKKDEKSDKAEANALEDECLYHLSDDKLEVKTRSDNSEVAKLREKYLLNMKSSNRKDHRRFLNHMIFDKKTGKYVCKKTSKANILSF